MATPTAASALVSPPPPVTSVPALAGLPVLGNLLDFRRDRLALQDRATRIAPLARLALVHVPLYVTADADLAHRVLVEDAGSYKKSAGLQYLMPLLGEGLLTSEDPTHKRHRKLLAPAFAPKRLAAYGDLMVDETRIQMERWQRGQELDLSREMMELTLAIAGRTFFHADVRGDAGAVGHGLELAMHAMVDEITSPIRLGYGWPLPRHLKMRRAVKQLDEVVYRVIADGRAAGVDRGDVLSMLLLARDEDGTALDDKQVRDEVMTLLLAGHETTANLLTWIWYELGRNPGVLEQLETEVERVVGTRRVTTDDLPALPYTLAVIEEALRLHPPAYITGRETTTEVELGGHRLPARAIITIYIRALQRQARYYTDPLAFHPERMLPEAKKLRPRHHFIPFGAGPRVCIGSHFALMEAQLVLATMIQHARLRLLATHVVPEPLITLRPKGGMPARVDDVRLR